MSEILGKIDVNNYSLQNMVAGSGGGKEEDLTIELGAQDTALSTQQTRIDELESALDNKIALDLANATSDADAVASDIAQGKTAYVNGIKLTGTAQENENNAKVNGIFEQRTGLANTLTNILVEIPELDLSVITSMNNFFSGCNNLEKIGGLKNMNNVTSMSATFSGCEKLKAIPILDTENVTTMASCFSKCIIIENAPEMTDLYNVRYASNLFSGCTNLKNVPIFTWGSIRTKDAFLNMFLNCPSLTNESLNNILAMVNTFYFIASADKTLKNLGLSQTQAETCKTLSNWDAFVAAGWSTGYES